MGGAAPPWGRAIIPMEMISVLLGSSMDLAGFRGKGSAVGLFARQEIRLLAGPLFVDPLMRWNARSSLGAKARALGKL